MSISNNWHCDICEKFWSRQQFAPAALLGITLEGGFKLGEPSTKGGAKHICKECAIGIAEGVAKASSQTHDFKKLTTYYSQEDFNDRQQPE